MDKRSGWPVTFLLASLAALDALLAFVGLVLPQLWFTVFHGVFYLDPEGLLPRTAAGWAAFAAVQTVALVRWRREPYWLAVVAGVRLGDVLTDWTYLAFCADITPLGRKLLLIASPANALAAWFLLRSFLTRRTISC